VLSLGRSEDVVFIREIKEIEPQMTIDVKGDIKLKYPTYILEEKLPISKMKYPVYFIPLAVHFKNQGQYVKHKSEITRKSERNVDFKKVFYTGYDYNLILQEGEKITCEFYELNGKKIIIIEGGWL
jgi:CRISPR-associated protein Cas5t